MTATRPLAVGMIYEPAYPTPAEQGQARTALTLHAHREGFTLLEIFDFSGGAVHDEAARQFMLELVGRIRFAALFVAGPADWSVLKAVVQPTRLPVHFAPERTASPRRRQVRSGLDRQGWLHVVPPAHP